MFTPAAFLLKDKHLRYAGYGRLDFESVWELGPEAAMEYESMKSKEPEQLFSVMEHSGNWCLRSGWHGDSDYLQDGAAGDLPFFPVENLVLHLIHQSRDLLCADRTFNTGPGVLSAAPAA